jgi:hypothetical protein
MKRIWMKYIILVSLTLVTGLYAQLPIPSWAQWLSDDEKSWKVFTTKGGCRYEELNMSTLSTFKNQVVDRYIEKGWDITEENIEMQIEAYWERQTKDYPLQHIEDGYRMLRIVDASGVSELHSGKVVVWEYYFKLKNVSSRKLTVAVNYKLTAEDGWSVSSDDMWFYIESGETGRYSSTAFFPIDDLEEIETRTWSISYDY